MCQAREHPKALVIAGPVAFFTCYFLFLVQDSYLTESSFLYSEGKILTKIEQGSLV